MSKDEQSQLPMINGIEVKVGQWWETRDETIRYKIIDIFFKGSVCKYLIHGNNEYWDLSGKNVDASLDGDNDLVKLIEDVE